MRDRIWSVLIYGLITASPVGAQGLGLGLGIDDSRSGGAPTWVLNGNGVVASLDYDFQNSRYYQLGRGTALTALVTVSRASSGTNLLPTTASGTTIDTFSSNVARVTSALGLLVEEARTNRLLNSTAPATQTTGSLGTGAYTLWINGSGTATMSAGSGTGCGTDAASQGVPVNFTITVAGTCTVTVAGSLNAFQLELGTFGTSLIVTAGVTATRAADAVAVTNSPVFGSAYTFLPKGTPNAPPAFGTAQVVLDVDDGTSNNRAHLSRLASTGGFGNIIVVGGVQKTAPSLAGTWNQSTSGKMILALAAADQAESINGATVTTSATTPIFTPSVITIGARQGGSQQWNGYVERIALWPTIRLPNAALQSLATP